MTKFYDAAMATWSPASFKPEVVVVYAEKTVRDWRWLWLRKTTRGEFLSLYHYPDIKVSLHKTTYIPDGDKR
jgi:hypothetical protein